jgi:hypothetical protein
VAEHNNQLAGVACCSWVTFCKPILISNGMRSGAGFRSTLCVVGPCACAVSAWTMG